MNVQRYTWEDAVVESETLGLISAAESRTAHALARVIEWEPSGKRAGMPSGLYWANDLACEVVGLKRSSFYRNIKGLKAAGLIKTKHNNLLPAIPESHSEIHEAFLERQQALVEAYNIKRAEKESLNNETRVPKLGHQSPETETTESHEWDTYSEDTYTDDSYSEDSNTVEAPVSASASPVTSSNNEFEEIVSLNFKEGSFPSLLNLKDAVVVNFEREEAQSPNNETSASSTQKGLDETEQDEDVAQFNNRLAIADIAAAIVTAKRHTNASAEFWAAVEEFAMDEDFKADVTNPMQRVGHAQAAVSKQLAAVGGW